MIDILKKQEKKLNNLIVCFIYQRATNSTDEDGVTQARLETSHGWLYAYAEKLDEKNIEQIVAELARIYETQMGMICITNIIRLDK